jgi:hypothetical protein
VIKTTITNCLKTYISSKFDERRFMAEPKSQYRVGLFLKRISMKTKILLFVMGLILTTQLMNAQVPSYIPTNGLVGYWPFNGNANDESGNGNNGTVISGLLSNDRLGNANSSYYLNGQTDYITVPAASNMLPNRLTLSVWVKIPSNYNGNNGIGPIIRARFYGYILWFDSSNGSIIHILHHNSSTATTTNTTNNINDNQWHQIVGTFDGTNNKLYLDGQLISTDTTTALSNLYYLSDGPVVFGRDGNNPSTATAMYQGWIDDIGIWNRALSQQEITNLYNSVNSTECLTMVINSGPLSTNPVTYTSTVNIYPNPANDQITIDCGNLANVVGWNIKITNALGQEVFSAPMNNQQYTVALNSWSGQGMYFVKILNAQNEVVNIKKIILQ